MDVGYIRVMSNECAKTTEALSKDMDMYARSRYLHELDPLLDPCVSPCKWHWQPDGTVRGFRHLLLELLKT